MLRAGAVLALLCALVVAPAEAQRVEGGVMAGWGTASGYGFGLGGRIATTIPLKSANTGAHAGGRFVYFFGETDTVTVAPLPSAEVEKRNWQAAAEFGFAIERNQVTIRPIGIIGVAAIRTVTAGVAVTDYEFLIGPGLLIGTVVGQRVLLAAEADYLYVKGFDSWAFFGTVAILTGP